MARGAAGATPLAAGETPLLVLAASVAAAERSHLQRILAGAGLEVRSCEGAAAAEAEISAWGRGRPCVLVIDSGFLEMPHDGQWRAFLERHPRLGAVVRCLVGEGPEAVRKPPPNPRRRLVHPDHEQGLLEAVHALAALASGAPRGRRRRATRGSG